MSSFLGLIFAAPGLAIVTVGAILERRDVDELADEDYWRHV